MTGDSCWLAWSVTVIGVHDQYWRLAYMVSDGGLASMTNNNSQLAWSVMEGSYLVFCGGYFAWPVTVAGLHGW